MALPIFPTPTLSGSDAKRFVEQLNDKTKRPQPPKIDASQIKKNIQKVKSGQKPL